MAMGTIIHFVLGVVLKIITGKISQSMALDREIKMAALHRHRDLLAATQAGKDTADWSLRILRFLVILPFVYVFLYLAYVVISDPTVQFHVQVNKSMSPIWQWFLPFPVTKEGYMLITGGSIIWKMWDAVWLIIGFVATKFGK